MCIRDRHGGEAVGRPHPDGAEADRRHHAAAASAAVRLAGCLLYTSDAADERSSVDLGGRRIIKKKTHDRQRQSVRG